MTIKTNKTALPKTTIKCSVYSCKYNTACCKNPYKEVPSLIGDFYCKKDTIDFDIDISDELFQCQDYAVSNKKEICTECNIRKNRDEINLADLEDEVEIVWDDDDDFEL